MGTRLSSHPVLPVLVIFFVLLADLFFRWLGPVPVEATRIAGRETDAAFTALAQSNRELAQSNRILARSIQQLTVQLGALKLETWARAQTDLAGAQKELKAAVDDISDRFSELIEALQDGGTAAETDSETSQPMTSESIEN